MALERLDDNLRYINKVNICTPNGIVESGTVMRGNKWHKIMVYGIGNCGINALFEVIPKYKKLKKGKNNSNFLIYLYNMRRELQDNKKHN